MAKTVNYKGKAPDELYVVGVEGVEETTFRTYVYEGQAVLRLHLLLKEGKKARIVRYWREDHFEDERLR